MNIYQLLALVLAMVIVYLATKSIQERFSVFVVIAGSILIIFFICTKISPVFSFILHLAESSGIKNEYFSVVLKGMAICYLSEFTVSSCKDVGLQGWGDKVELACRCSLLVLAIPLFEDFLDVVMGLLE